MSNSLKLKRLLLVSNKCHWCGCMVVKYHLKDQQKMPDNFATIDHLYSRLHWKRRFLFEGEKRVVLACHRCNQNRDKQECKKFQRYTNKSSIYSKLYCFLVRLKWILPVVFSNDVEITHIRIKKES